jgi:hypothetical protein
MKLKGMGIQIRKIAAIAALRVVGFAGMAACTTTVPTATLPQHDLYKKRRNALRVLLGAAATTGAASAAPTPGLEGPKQASIAIGDVVLMASIYNVYFDDDIGIETVKDMLTELGFVAAVSGGLAYGGVKATEAILSEVLNWVPVIGWIVSGVITASVTLTVGVLWLWACDTAMRQGLSPVKVIRHALPDHPNSGFHGNCQVRWGIPADGPR